jgi:hypothetical protein
MRQRQDTEWDWSRLLLSKYNSDSDYVALYRNLGWIVALTLTTVVRVLRKMKVVGQSQ